MSLVLNFGMLKFPVCLCVFECMSLRLCVSVPACECCMILFTYNLYKYVDVSFFTYCLQVCLCVCDNSGMFNVCVCILCVYVNFRETLLLQGVMTGSLGEEFIKVVPSPRDDL